MREQATLLAISHILASTLEFQPGLLLDQLREIVEYTYCRLFTLEDSTHVSLAMRGTPLLEASSPFRIHLPKPEILAALLNGGRPIRIADVWSDNSQAQFLRALFGDDAAALLKSQALLREQSVRDHLTGLFNHRYMEETLERELLRATRKQLSLGMIMLDVDNFKLFNSS